MRALRVLVVVMGVLIVVGTVGLVAAVVYRGANRAPASAPMLAGPQPDVVLDEPAGTRMVGVTPGTDTMVVRLEGGGPDRLVVLDARTGAVLRRVRLAR